MLNVIIGACRQLVRVFKAHHLCCLVALINMGPCMNKGWGMEAPGSLRAPPLCQLELQKEACLDLSLGAAFS